MLMVAGQQETAIRRDEKLRASSLYFRVRNELPADTGPRDVWRETLDRAFRAVSQRVGLLFDPDSEYGRLIPLQPTLARIVDGLNDPAIPSATWGDDEVLGWVYQYWNDPDRTAERFRPDPYHAGQRMYATGDRVRRTPDGLYHFLGRTDNQVKVRGFRIELGEVKAVLASHPAVRECVATVREDVPGDARLVAYWVSHSGDVPEREELRGFMADRLPAYTGPDTNLNSAADGNVFWAPGTGEKVVAGFFDRYRKSELFAASKKLLPSGSDAGSRVIDPLVGKDLRPTATSPIKGAGVELSKEWPDPLRVSDGKPDVGAIPTK